MSAVAAFFVDEDYIAILKKEYKKNGGEHIEGNLMRKIERSTPDIM